MKLTIKAYRDGQEKPFAVVSKVDAIYKDLETLIIDLLIEGATKIIILREVP